jgi:hypothetical protein
MSRPKQGYTAREMENGKWILISAGVKFRNEKKFRYGIPAYTDPFRALIDVLTHALVKLLYKAFVFLRCFHGYAK